MGRFARNDDDPHFNVGFNWPVMSGRLYLPLDGDGRPILDTCNLENAVHVAHIDKPIDPFSVEAFDINRYLII